MCSCLASSENTHRSAPWTRAPHAPRCPLRVPTPRGVAPRGPSAICVSCELRVPPLAPDVLAWAGLHWSPRGLPLLSSPSSFLSPSCWSLYLDVHDFHFFRQMYTFFPLVLHLRFVSGPSPCHPFFVRGPHPRTPFFRPLWAPRIVFN